MSAHIDPRAVVSPNVQFGDGVRIGPFTIIENDVIIGDGTTIAANALIGTGARIGKDCRIHHGAVVSHEPQDLKYRGEKSTCEIGDRTIVREYATLHRGTGEGGRTTIGSDCLLMGYVHIAHDCVVGNNVIFANAVMIAGHSLVEDYVIIGGITPVHQFVRIGQHSMIGGGLRVPKDVPPYILAGQEPLIFNGLNSIGLRRRGFTPEVITALDSAYTILYNSRLNVSQAVQRIREDERLAAVPEVQNVLTFIAGSTRGIIAGPRRRG